MEAGRAREPRVTLCVLARDEERDLPGCLASASGAADEIVVVDTGSRDRTAAIAREHGAIVVEFPWREDFAAARNAGLERASGEWILVLDCDERLAPGAAAAVRAAAGDAGAAAFRLEVVSEVGGALPQRASLVRLFRNDPRVRYVRRIHETVNEALVGLARARGLSIRDLDAPILHHGYVPERFAALRKRERNLRLHALTVEDRPEDAYAWYRYGDELRAVDRGRAAEALARSWDLLLALAPAERRRHVYAPEVPALRALQALEAGETARALALADEGIAAAGATPNLRYVRALVLERAGDAAAALGEYRWLRAQDGLRTEAPVQPGITGPIACHGAAQCHESLGDARAAEEAYREALALAPRFSRAALALARLLQRSGRGAEARRDLDEYLKRAPGDGDAWALSGVLALEAGAPAAAAQRLGIAAASPQAPASVLRDLERAQRAQGDAEGARRTAARLTQSQPLAS